MYYVYWYRLPEHTDIKTQGYVGITYDLNARNAGHKHSALTLNKPYRFSNAIRKYRGEIVRDVVCITAKEHALYLEQKLRPEPNIGWNSAPGGGDAPSPLGRTHSDETKAKISAAHKGKSRGQSPFKGKTDRHSPETRALIGSYHKGKKISQTHREAISMKVSGANSPAAKTIHLAHIDDPSKVYKYPCVREAADALNLNYQTLRSQFQYTQKNRKTSDPSRTGWICLYGEDSNSPEQAVAKAISARSKRSSGIPKSSGKSHYKSRSILLESKKGELQTFDSISQAAKAIGINEATLRYHEQQARKKQQDASFTKQGWRVKYVEVLE